MISPKTERLVPIRHLMLALGKKSYGTSTVEAIIKKHRLEIVAESDYGKGTMRMLRHSDVERVVELEKQEERETSPEIVHTGAIEAKLDRIEAEIKGLHQAMGEFTKASNLIADRLGKVLEQLGVQN